MARNIARTIDIDKTKTGLILAIVGLILGAVPFVPYVGSLLVIVGIILVALGREPFGNSHSKYVKASVILIALGIVIGYVAAFAAQTYLDQVSFNGQSQVFPSQSVISIFVGLFVVLLVGGLVISLGYVILTYDLQDSSGRLELYTGFVAQLVVWILIAYVFSGIVSAAVSAPLSLATFDISQIRTFQTQLQYLELAGLIPAGLFADAYYRAYSRINKGELPQGPSRLGPTSPRYMKT